MSRTSCITHTADDTFVIVRHSYLKLCNGDPTAAALIHIFEQWHNTKLNAQRNHVDQDPRPCDQTPLPTLWQFHKSEELLEQLVGIGKRHSLDQARRLLVELGIVHIGRNPNKKYRFDATTFYLFQPDRLNALLSKLPSAEISTDATGAENYIEPLLKTESIGAENGRAIPNTLYSDPDLQNSRSSGERQPAKEKAVPSASEHEGISWPWETETFWEAWVTWREFKRKQHKFVFKLKASEQAALNLLRELSGDSEAIAHAIIRQSLAHGWKGFHELKTSTNATDQTVRTATWTTRGQKPGTSQARTDALSNWGSKRADPGATG